MRGRQCRGEPGRSLFTCSDALPVHLPVCARGWHSRHSEGTGGTEGTAGGEIDSSQARDWSSQPVWSLPAPFKEHMGSCRTRRHRSRSLRWRRLARVFLTHSPCLLVPRFSPPGERVLGGWHPAVVSGTAPDLSFCVVFCSCWICVTQ